MSEHAISTNDQTNAPTSAARVSRLIYGILAWLTFIGVLVQIFLAGSAVFVDYSRFDIHRGLGYFLFLPTLLMIVTAFAGRLPRSMIGQTFGLLVMLILQIVFVELRDTGLEEIAALHVLNAFGIFGSTMDLGRKSVSYLRPAAEPTRA